MNKAAIIVIYALVIVACALIIESLVCATSGSVDLAGYLAALACFCLLLGVWLNVCS